MGCKFDLENPFKNQQSQPKAAMDTTESKGLKIDHFFSNPSEHPFEQLEWENRSAKIASDSGEVIFEQDNIEVPTSWSQLATKVVASKYFYGDVETGLSGVLLGDCNGVRGAVGGVDDCIGEAVFEGNGKIA